MNADGDTALDIVFAAKVPDGGEHAVTISGSCDQDGNCEAIETLTVTGAEWAEYRTPAACLGLTDMTSVQIPAVIGTEEAGTVAMADIRFEPSTGEAACTD